MTRWYQDESRAPPWMWCGHVPMARPILSLICQTSIIAPHIGGATFEAALRGVTILAKQLEQFIDGQPMSYVANQVAVGGQR